MVAITPQNKNKQKLVIVFRIFLEFNVFSKMSMCMSAPFSTLVNATETFVTQECNVFVGMPHIQLL